MVTVLEDVVTTAGSVIKAIKKLPSVDVKIIPKVKEVIPTIDGKDKSISPSVTTNVAEIAIIPKKGIDCIKAL